MISLAAYPHPALKTVLRTTYGVTFSRFREKAGARVSREHCDSIG